MSNVQHNGLTGSELHVPKVHKDSHVDGTDDIQDATSGQKGLATATQITKLDGVEAGATVDQTAEEILSLTEFGADNRSEKFTGAIAYTKIKQIDLIIAPDSIIVEWEQKTGGGGGTSFARVYRNGGAVGVVKSRGDNIYAWRSDTTAGWSSGDTLEIWGYNSVSTGHHCYIKNMKISTTPRLSGTSNDP
jgi:hypothetical protein